MQPEYLAIGERAQKALARWASAYDAIQLVGVDLGAPNAHTPNASIDEVWKRVSNGLSAMTKLQDVDPAALDLAAPRLAGIASAVDGIDATAKAIIDGLNPWAGATATDQNGHLNLQIQHPEKGGASFDLGSPLGAIFKHANQLLDQLPYVAQVVSEEAAPIFASIAKEIQECSVDAKAAAAKAKDSASKADGLLDEIKSVHQSGSALVEKLDALLVAAREHKGSAETHTAEIEQKHARAREISKDADALQQRITGFEAQFQAFESQMKSRLEQFAEFEESTEKATRDNLQREAKIAELIEKADTMIRGATTAGLSKSLDDTTKLYETRLKSTQWAFLASAVVLLVCSLPIAAQLIPGPWQTYVVTQVPNGSSDSAGWLSALGKLILVIPATWATAFFAANYAELFHLAREYAHKAALAKAIDGFKREAPDYEQEIVASVFMEIQDNPGSRKAPKAATPQNPITQGFLSKVLEAFKTVQKSK